jgi:AcrR family transcriptional regulator
VRRLSSLPPAERIALTEQAPSRGCYDRALSRPERQAQHRDRLLLALASAYARVGAKLTVSSVVEQAGVGRNTFYEYFDDIPHALHIATQRFASLGDALLSDAVASNRTPFSRVRALVAAWAQLLRDESALARLAFALPSELCDPLASFSAALRSVVEQNPTIFARARDPVVFQIALGGVKAGSLLVLETPDPEQATQAAQVMTDLLFRMIR